MIACEELGGPAPSAVRLSSSTRADAAVGGVAAMLAHERLVLEFWTETSNDARRVVEEGRFRKAANRPGLTRTHEKKFVMTEGQYKGNCNFNSNASAVDCRPD